MSNYYKGTKGFSYLQVPERLIELRPQLQGFSCDFWEFVHIRINKTRDSTSVLLTDDQIVNHAFWRDRKINPREISRARAALKKLGLLHYTKEGTAWTYFAVNPVTGVAIDPAEAVRQAKEEAAIKNTQAIENAELAKVRAELAALKAQLASQSSVKKSPPKREFDEWGNEDTGQVQDDVFIQ